MKAPNILDWAEEAVESGFCSTYDDAYRAYEAMYHPEDYNPEDYELDAFGHDRSYYNAF